MKKSTLLLSMAMIATGAFAQAPQEKEENIIKEAVGTHYQMQASEDFFFLNTSTIDFTSGDRIIFDVVIDEENGDVYVKNIFNDEPVGAYVKGKKEGNKITFSLPQLYEIYVSMAYGKPTGVEHYYYAERLKKYVNYLGELEYFIPKDEEDVLVFEINEDGSWSCPELDQKMDSDGLPEYIFGLERIEWSAGTLLEPMFAGAGFCNFKAEAFDKTPLNVMFESMPEKWSIISKSGSRFVNVYLNEDEILIGNWSPLFPDSYVMGKIVDGKIRIETDQYLGRDEKRMRYISLMAAPVTVSTNPANGAYIYDFGNLVEGDIVLDYDAEKKTISAEGLALLLNGDTKKVVATVMFVDPVMTSANAAPAKPQTPEVNFTQQYSDAFGYGQIEVNIPMLDVNGNLLDTSKMYYNIYIDGDEIYEFWNDEYAYIPESPMVNVPYSFNDEFDFIVDGTVHTIYVYTTAKSWGCRSVYKDGDTELVSDLGEGFFAAVDLLESENAVSTEYYDLMGRKISNPANGIFISKSMMEDGTVRAAKQMIR